jgi:mRNA interferase MazF
MPEPIQFKRGEIWLTNFDPTLGTEIKKIRPAVILSADAIGRLPIKLVAPITDWKPYFESNLWHIKLEPTTPNGLSKTSAIDALQLRGLDTQRFIRKLGNLDAETMAELALAIITVIEAN